MKILAIDYGRKKMGVAVASSKIAEPHSVIVFTSDKEVIRKILDLIKVEQVERVVVGISEGEMAKETKKFAEKLKENIKIPVVFQDETLSSHEAQKRAIQAGVKKTKRKELEDSYAATIILQNYLDKN